MDKTGQITNNNTSAGNLAVDGLIYGLLSGVAMVLTLTVLVVLIGESPGRLLEYFGAGGLASPIQGLLSHLTVSAIYGMIFGVLFWPIRRRLPPNPWLGWLVGEVYGMLLFLLAQFAILPGMNSPLAQLPVWIWVSGHAVYGLVVGGLFSRK